MLSYEGAKVTNNHRFAKRKPFSLRHRPFFHPIRASALPTSSNARKKVFIVSAIDYPHMLHSSLSGTASHAQCSGHGGEHGDKDFE